LASSTNDGLAAGTGVALAEDTQALTRPFLTAMEPVAQRFTSRETRKPPRAGPMEDRVSLNSGHSGGRAPRARVGSGVMKIAEFKA